MNKELDLCEVIDLSIAENDGADPICVAVDTLHDQIGFELDSSAEDIDQIAKDSACSYGEAAVQLLRRTALTGGTGEVIAYDMIGNPIHRGQAVVWCAVYENKQILGNEIWPRLDIFVTEKLEHSAGHRSPVIRVHWNIEGQAQDRIYLPHKMLAITRQLR